MPAIDAACLQVCGPALQQVIGVRFWDVGRRHGGCHRLASSCMLWLGCACLASVVVGSAPGLTKRANTAPAPSLLAFAAAWTAHFRGVSRAHHDILLALDLLLRSLGCWRAGLWQPCRVPLCTFCIGRLCCHPCGARCLQHSMQSSRLLICQMLHDKRREHEIAEALLASWPLAALQDLSGRCLHWLLLMPPVPCALPAAQVQSSGLSIQPFSVLHKIGQAKNRAKALRVQLAAALQGLAGRCLRLLPLLPLTRCCLQHCKEASAVWLAYCVTSQVLPGQPQWQSCMCTCPLQGCTCRQALQLSGPADSGLLCSLLLDLHLTEALHSSCICLKAGDMGAHHGVLPGGLILQAPGVQAKAPDQAPAQCPQGQALVLAGRQHHMPPC